MAADATRKAAGKRAVLMREFGEMPAKDFISVLMDRVRKGTEIMVKPALNELVRRGNESVEAINILIQRVKELEKKALNFRGVWQSDVVYEKGDLVMRKNSLFYCNSTGVKGFDPREARGSDAWKMMTSGSGNREWERE